jgi:adenine deaminase
LGDKKMFHVEHFFKIYKMKICGNLIDIHNRKIFPAEVNISGNRIASINRADNCPDGYILPGLIDSHIHIESTMITPAAFGYAAVRHGTTGVISDPHEIANVLGMKGIDFMIEDAGKSPVRFWFGAPSCVPATGFETSGAVLAGKDIELLMKRKDIRYLSEMMNFPGVILRDKEVMAKISAARKYNKPVDGHAPGLSGANLRKYVSAGISTDHECSTLEEAKEKLALGMKILIREGSAARNLDALKDLYKSDPDMVMLCSDDLHPEMLEKRHINKLIARLVSEGFDPVDVIRSATINPVDHYNLEAGLLRIGDRADLIVVDSLNDMNVRETWIDGKKVFDNGTRNFSYIPGKTLNNFVCRTIDTAGIRVSGRAGNMRIIEAFDGELLTKEVRKFISDTAFVLPDIHEDILKIVVKERYRDAPPETGFIKGFGLKQGAFASSVAHDSHNIVSVGTNDEDIAAAINKIVRMKGGLAVSINKKVTSLQLNIGGIMSDRSCEDVAREYNRLNKLVQSLGCTMSAPFMTLSFMALLVIPDLKIGDRGLFDVNLFKPVPLFVEPAVDTDKLY